MNKKLLVSVFLCFFVLSLGMVAKEKKGKAPTIEFLDRIATFSPSPALWELTPEPTILTEFQSDTIFSLHVPPSPKSNALFLDLSAQYFYAWSGYQYRRANGAILLEIKSDVIPEDIEVFTALTIISTSDTNNALNESTTLERSWRNFRYMIKRDSNGDWFAGQFRVLYTSGQKVEDEIAIPIINSLIDNGFDVEIHADGYVRGIKWIELVLLSIEVTRLSKN